MKNLSLSSTECLIKENLRYSVPSKTLVMKDVHYSRHLSSGHGIRSSNTKSQKMIHATIRSSKNSRRRRKNKSVHPTIDLPSIPSGLILSKSSHNSYPQKHNKHNNGIVLQKNHFPSNSNRIFKHMNSKNVFENNNNIMKKEDWSSNTRDLLENLGKRKKEKSQAFMIRRCTWALVFLTTALILGTAIAGALIATLIKSDTTTTSTAPETTTTINMTSTTITATSTTVTITPTTITTTLSTTFITTSSTTTTIIPSTTTITTLSTTVTTTSSTTTTSTTESTTGTTTTTTSTTTTAVQTIITVDPSSTSSGYYGTDTVSVNCSTTLTNITVYIFVPITNNATYNTAYGTYWSGTVNSSYIANSTDIIYTFIIISGQTITCSGAPYTFTAEFNTNGTARVTSGDTYIVTGTDNSGMTSTLSGHF